MVQLYSSDTVLIKTDLPLKLKFEVAFAFSVVSSWNHWPKNRFNEGMHAQAMPIFPSAIPETNKLKPTHVLSKSVKLSSRER